MPLVIDASVAFKWFVPEPDDDRALALLDHADALIAPDLIFTEIASAMWVRLRPLADGSMAALAAQPALRRLLSRTYPVPPLIDRALEISFELNHPIYDCIYLALCEREQATMIAADKKLARKIRGTGYEQWLTML